jgi:molybdopterin-dependent oxidoreductase alpha subunit
VTTRPPTEDHTDEHVRIGAPQDKAAGLRAVAASLRTSFDQMGVAGATRTLLHLNQADGFDCPGCAWPDPAHAKRAEFCENGAKHVAAEATRQRVTTELFRQHSVSDLAARSDWWLEEQGRLTEPMVKRAGRDHYEPVSWDEAFALIADELQALVSPDEAVFYTSGRTSNEAAFVYQLFVRAFGTNNLPDCSNMCHESSGRALGEALGSGKGSCTLDDLERSELIVICGQNPGTNHPRMLTHLEVAKRNGATIIAVNPLPEAGLVRFKNPQTPRGLIGAGTVLADLHVPVRLAGDQALFLAIGKLLLEAEDRRPGTVLDRDFIAAYTDRFDIYAAGARAVAWSAITDATGLSRSVIEQMADHVMRARSMIVCWAMGLTQHRDSVAMIQEIVNVLLLRGNIGREGAGVFPVRGHSNVQGDRTMGISEQMPASFLDALRNEFGFEPPRARGLDAVGSIRSMAEGRTKVLIAMGGNLVRAMADTGVTEDAIRKLRLTVSVATKLNRSHVVTGATAVILPTFGRSERDADGGRSQVVTVEDSVGMVHASRGQLAPASAQLRSEVAIVCGLARRTLGDKVSVDWEAMAVDNAVIRGHIARVVVGFEDFNAKIERPGGFLLPHAARDERRFATDTGKAHFSANQLGMLRLPPGRLLLQTIRSHDQFNTTVYSYDDRYRGVHGSRHVVFVNADDLRERGLADGDTVDIVGEWDDGIERRVEGYRAVAYPTPRDCAAAYYPQTNVLVPLGSVAKGSNTPTSKSVVVRLEKQAKRV